jgi:hypothetical protein
VGDVKPAADEGPIPPAPPIQNDVPRFSCGYDIRLEAASATVRNPFTGADSFTASGGATVDEPGSVGKTDYRLALVYNFSRASLSPGRE